ncbi:glycosyltransferase family 4 protein [Cellulomonas sp. NPDC057328]|uniref:glycosyltransferase family 4 protein n=1 Tax=Cellulomonas sp. NPDC057328 TaxID=3346101 RepID=UPI00363C2524
MRVLMPGRILERHVGGNTTYARELASHLRRLGVQVDAMPYGATPAATLALETLTGLRREKAVLHYTSDTGPLISTRTPSVLTVHGIASRWISTARTPSQERVWRARVSRAIRSVDRLVTVSESSADDIAAVFGVDRGDVTVIPHGIDHATYATPTALSDAVRASLPPDFLLYLGNVEPRKNLVELVRAVELDAGLPPLVIAGKPAWNHEESMRAIAASTRTTYLGFVSDSDRVALMQACTAFVFPSLYEGFGFPVVEALAAGAPVITSDRGSLVEVSGPSRMLAGLDAAAVAAGVAEALADDEWTQRCRAEGPLWAAHFSWEASARRHLEVYEAAR